MTRAILSRPFLAAVLPTLAASYAILAPTTAAAAQSWTPTTPSFPGTQFSYMYRPGADCSGAAMPLGNQFLSGELSPYTSPPGGAGYYGRVDTQLNQRIPWVMKLPASTATQSVLGSVVSPGSGLWIHPGRTNEKKNCVVIRFTAPAQGAYRVSGFIKSIDTMANSVNGHIIVNDNQIGATIPLNSGFNGAPKTFDEVVHVTSGGSIDFALDDGGNSNNDSTQLDLTITRCEKHPGVKDNCPGGSIVIRKLTTPGYDDQDFTFSGTGPNSWIQPPFKLDNDSPAIWGPPYPERQQLFPGLSAGSYTFTEQPTPGWKLVEINCPPNGPQLGAPTVVKNIAAGTVTINLPPNQQIQCNFVNMRN